MKKIKWTTVIEYVDYETGEVINPKTVQEEYIVIKKHKHTKFKENEHNTTGIITFTNICRKLRYRQATIF